MANGVSVNGDIRLGMIEVRPYRPFKSSEEYLWAMKEDLAEWLSGLYGLKIAAESFCEVLETGTVLCRHSNNVRRKALEFLAECSDNAQQLHPQRNSHLPFPVPSKEVTYRENVLPATFQARDNVSNFISWCRALNIHECLLFETDDLVLRKNEKSFILCLLEVARRGSKVGMPTPLLVQMEEEIDREIAIDNAKRMRDSGVETDAWAWPAEIDLEPHKQIITNDLKSLDEMVRDLVNRCTCPVQFPMIRISEGKYRIGDTKTLIFVRILRNHVMVRVGGGWDTLAHYLDKHDPCRCRQGHKAITSSRLTIRHPTSNNVIGQTPTMMVEYQRTPEMSPSSPNPHPVTHSPQNRSISPVHHYTSPQQQTTTTTTSSRQRRSSASSTTSSHEHSTESSSSVAGEPIVSSSKVGSLDSAYCSSPSAQRRTTAILDSQQHSSSFDSSAKINGTNDFSKQNITSTPQNKTSKPTSRIPTSDNTVVPRKKNLASPTSQLQRNGYDTGSLGRPFRVSARASSFPEPQRISRSYSHTDDMHLGTGTLTRAQDIRRSCRLPRSPSTHWTPNANGGTGSVNGHGNHDNDKNRTWSGFRAGTRIRPSLSPDIYIEEQRFRNDNTRNSNFRPVSDKKVLHSDQNFSSSPTVKHCPTLLREILCDPTLDSNKKVLEKMERILAANSKKDIEPEVEAEVAVLSEEKDEDYTKRWVTDTVDQYGKSLPPLPGMASPEDYGSDVEAAAAHQQLIKIKKPIASPRKNNHPLTETKIPMPTY
ncbi:hypothetical protein CHUAL_005929 [Chamberlinius hualienensis]